MHISNLKISINEYKRLVDEDIKKRVLILFMAVFWRIFRSLLP